jgi:hypothetical protein
VQSIAVGLMIYFEVPPVRWTECAAATANSGHKMKIRVGGETRDNSPKFDNVVEFLHHCRRTGCLSRRKQVCIILYASCIG